MLVVRLSAAEKQVLDRGRIELRDLREGGADGCDSEVLRAHVCERALVGATDRRAGGGNDDGFSHGTPRSDGVSEGSAFFDACQEVVARGRIRKGGELI